MYDPVFAGPRFSAMIDIAYVHCREDGCIEFYILNDQEISRVRGLCTLRAERCITYAKGNFEHQMYRQSFGNFPTYLGQDKQDNVVYEYWHTIQAGRASGRHLAQGLVCGARLTGQLSL